MSDGFQNSKLETVMSKSHRKTKKTVGAYSNSYVKPASNFPKKKKDELYTAKVKFVKVRCNVKGLAVFLALSVYAAIAGLLALWTERSIQFFVDTWGNGQDVPYWVAFLATFFLNGIGLAFNVITEIVRLFV